MRLINVFISLLYFIPISLIAQFQDMGGPEGGQVLDVVFVNDTVYTLTSASLFYSVNDGNAWRVVPGSNDLPSQLTNVSIDKGVIYLSVNHRNVIFKSENFGQSWTQIEDDVFYSQGDIKGFESFNDTLYIYSTTDVFMSPDRGANFRVIEHLNQSFPFILVHNRILHFKNYHYYLTPNRKLVRTKDFTNPEVLFDLGSNYYYRLYRNETTLFLMEIYNANITLYKLDNEMMVVYKENLNLTNLNLSDYNPISFDGNIVYEKYSLKYSTDGWYSTNYISLQVNPNPSWSNNPIKIHNGIVYYNWGNLFSKQNLADSTRVNITNNMIGNKNSSIFKSGAKIISGTNPISYYNLPDEGWDVLDNGRGSTFFLNDNLILKYDKSKPTDSIEITTIGGQLFKKSKFPYRKVGANDDIYGINDLIFVCYLFDSLYVSDNYGESWKVIDRQDGVGRFSANYSNNNILVNSGYNTTWYVSKDGVNYTVYDPDAGGAYASVDENDNIYYKKNELIYKYNKALNTAELIPLPFTIKTHYNANTICFEHYKNTLFVGGIGEGLFVSFDEGKNWDTFNEGLETKNISSIEIDDEYIYVGTYGHIYKRPLSELNAIHVFGEVFEDVNQNGIKELNENLLKNIHVRSTVNNIIKPTNELGQFSLITKDIADNKIEIIEPQYSTATNGPILISNNSNPIQLGISFDKEVNDVGIKILSPFVFRPGFNTVIDLYLENLSYNDRIIRVGLIFDDKLTLKNSSYSPYSLSGNNLSYEDIFLNGRDSKIITLIFETEVNSNIGDIISLTSYVELKNNIDIDSSNNSYNLIDTIRGSFDPNDKSVHPNADIIYDQNILNQELLYTIRFQNTGNYPAEFVILRDTFEMTLDPNSIDILSYSHPCEWQIKNGRVLEVKFANINLPDSTVSVELSQGYVTFKLKLNQNVAKGSVIANKASIYFDYNPPIVTERIITNIVEPSSIDPSIKPSFRIVPNPSFNDIILKDIPFSKAGFEIYDMAGNVVSKGIITSSDNTKININHLTTGQYIITLKSQISKEIYSSGFIKI